MRWTARRLGSCRLLSLSWPILLLLASATLSGQPAHALETCPVNPFQAFQEPTSCIVTSNETSHTVVQGVVTAAETPEAAVSILTDTTTENSRNQDDRTLSTPASVAVTATTSTLNDTSTATTSTSTPASTSQVAKEDVWTEIDDSIGLSWTPELEAEYEKAHRDFELHTQAAAASPPTISVHLEEAAEPQDKDTSIPEFPSYAEWKERHIAANIVAGNQAAKEGRENRLSKEKASRKNNSNLHGKSPNKSHASEEESPLLDNTEDLWTAQHRTSTSGEDGSKDLTPHRERIFHPVPHAGTGDPLLDPLIALRDRTNYASFDCSATLIRSSKSTKFASAILSSKKDRYMLTPCAEKEKYVIVELCDEIQIDNIVLANLEFFSSMFKMFRVSGGTAYPESAGTWNEIGTFRASNARGMQVFRPPEPTKGGFYRYLRIDFLSHYGSEYYCPVSLLKVYGLTQLDAYRRDEERQNRLATSEDAEEIFAQMEHVQPDIIQEEPVYLQLVEPVKVHAQEHQESTAAPVETIGFTPTEEVSLMPSSSLSTKLSSTWSLSVSVPPKYASTTQTIKPQPTPPEAVDETAQVLVTQVSSPSVNAITASPTSAAHTSHDTILVTSSVSRFSKQSKDSTTAVPRATSIPTGTSASVSQGTGSPTDVLDKPTESRTAPAISSPSNTPSNVPQSKKASSSPSLVYRSAQSPAPPAARRNDSKPQVIYTHAHNANHQPNESIYGTIMKRLLALEVNATLSTTYLEEQSRVVRETFRRIEDRLTNMEKTRAKYDQLLRRVMLDLELHRARHEAERTELSGQLNVLSREMVMEKRLGIAQLLALVILMFFVVLTRGSPSSPILNLAHSRVPNNNAPFPTIPRSRRPRSLRDESLETFPPVDFRALPARERRGVGSGSRGGMHAANGNGLTRNTSVKRPYRTSNNLAKRPVTALPLRRNGFEFPSNGAGGFPIPVTLASETPPPSNTATYADVSGRSSRASSPVGGLDGAALGMSDHDLSSSTVTLRGSTPPLYPAPPKTRRSPVETLRRKLRLMQPRRAASLDGTGISTSASVPLQSNASPSTVLDRRKKFGISHVPYLRDRSDTMDTISSIASEENSKAWLSTSEDSGDDHSNSTPLSGGSPGSRFESFSRLSAQNSPSKQPYVPPSPDPSDAETPAPVYKELPPHASPGRGSL